MQPSYGVEIFCDNKLLALNELQSCSLPKILFTNHLSSLLFYIARLDCTLLHLKLNLYCLLTAQLLGNLILWGATHSDMYLAYQAHQIIIQKMDFLLSLSVEMDRHNKIKSRLFKQN